MCLVKNFVFPTLPRYHIFSKIYHIEKKFSTLTRDGIWFTLRVNNFGSIVVFSYFSTTLGNLDVTTLSNRVHLEFRILCCDFRIDFIQNIGLIKLELNF